MAAIVHFDARGGGVRRRQPRLSKQRCSMHGRIAAALVWGGMAAVLAGCSSGKDAAATDSARADSATAATSAMTPAADSTSAAGAGVGASALTSDIAAAENAWRIAVAGGDT